MGNPVADIAGRDFGFDEAWYLEAYPDIAKAVQDGVVPSALTHYVKFGRDEGRLAFPFDSEWYARAYPLAVQETGSADARALHQHYLNIGSFRGYRSHPRADRPKNAAKTASDFGGLWIDSSNAKDLIAGKYEIGRIDRSEESLLNAYVQDGYVRIAGAVPAVLIDR